MTRTIGDVEALCAKYAKMKQRGRNPDSASMAVEIIDSLSLPDFTFDVKKEALVVGKTTTYVYENNATYPFLFEFIGELLHSKIPIEISEVKLGPGEILVNDGKKDSADEKLNSAIKELQTLIHAKKAEASRL